MFSKKDFIVFIPFSFLYSLTPVIETLIIQLFITQLENAKQLSSSDIFYFFIFIVFMFIIILIIRMLYTYVFEKLVKNKMLFLEKKGYEFYLDLNNSSKDMMTYYTSELELFRKNYLESIFNSITEGLIYIFSMCYLFFISIEISLLMMIISFIPIIISRLYEKSIYHYSQYYTQSKGSYFNYIDESCNGKECINIYGAIKYFHFKHIKKSEESENTRFRLNIKIFNAKNLINFIVMIMNSASFVLIIYLLINNSINLAKAVAVVQLSNTIVNPLVNISDYINRIKGCKGILSKIREFMSADFIENMTYTDFTEISIEHLSYCKNEKNILKDIALEIKKNEKILIYGSSGSGKTTLARFLLGLLESCDYRIFLNGEQVNISNVDNLFSYTSANEVLFNDSFYNNVTLGKDINKEDYDRVLSLCFLEDIKKEDEKGKKYSNGEIQRIAIARCFCHDKPIWIWDEALNGIDTQRRKVIESNILSLSKTFIHITHNINYQCLTKYDKFVVLNNGKLKMFSKTEEFINYVK